MLRHTEHYRCEVFAAGLTKHGFQCQKMKWDRNPRPSDLLVVWNRGRAWDPIAALYEACGARVLVVENGYLDRAEDGSKFYSLALGGHNGSGSWYVGDRPRFEIKEEPWRENGSKVLILPQRGIGQLGVAMPSSWPIRIEDRLAAITDRPLLVRPHPGHVRNTQPLDFRDVWCAVTWGSGAGIKAIRAGIPVFYDLPCWIGGAAAARLAGDIETCQTPERGSLWTRISWAQWKLDEIGSGEAFDRLLHEDHRSLYRAA
jgi:hypothetical protein